MEVHERLSKLEVKIQDLEHNQGTIEEHLKKVRDNMNQTNSLIQDLRVVVAELKVTNENQTRVLEELQRNRERESAKREDDKRWIIRTVGAIIITALLSLIIV